ILRRCVIAACSNTHKDGVSTNLWPKNEKLALKWDQLVRLKQADWSKGTVGTSTVCGAHFIPEDFDGYNQWMARFGMRHRLKPGAVPSVNVKLATSVSYRPTGTL
uniref:THAP-type domain-containing protein n=1 Tax=Salmo trutta TaxID=8032 RepID=A0A674E034_SALTR